jgi:Phage integrase, N-terminal SAM-like domain
MDASYNAKIGPAWTDRGRPGAGYFTKRTAEAWLRDLLEEARRGTLPGLVKTDATFAQAADEWLRYIEHDRDRKPSTVAGYKAILRSQLLPTFGEMPIESITTPMIETSPRGGIRAGRRDLPDRRLHWPAPWRAARAALARRRFQRPGHPGSSELRRGRADDAKVRQGPLGPDGAGRSRSTGKARPTRALDG